MYPNNLEFSCQFIKSKLSYYDIIEIRKLYENHINWKEAYQKFKDKVTESTFWEIYTGRSFKLIRPEVFTQENKKIRTSLSHSGEKNSHVKLTKKDVINIRKLYNDSKMSQKEISKLYPQVSKSTIYDIVHYRSWKNI